MAAEDAGGLVAPDPTDSLNSGQQFQTAPGLAGQVPVSNGDGTFTWKAPSVISGVTVSGTAVTGDVIVATGATTATWQTQSAGLTGVTKISGVAVSGTPSTGQQITATSATAADWGTA